MRESDTLALHPDSRSDKRIKDDFIVMDSLSSEEKDMPRKRILHYSALYSVISSSAAERVPKVTKVEDFLSRAGEMKARASL